MTNKKLIEKYPFLDPGIEYNITWLDDMDPGWRKAFGEDFCEELLQALKDDDYSIAEKDDDFDGFRFEQIKEKYGSLRIYYNGHPIGKYRTRDTIAKYEELSKYICGHCGKPARYITKGWIYPLCDDCIQHVNSGYIPIEEYYSFDDYDEVLEEIKNIVTDFQYDRYWKSV